MHAEPTRRRIVIGPRAHELCQYVGPISWVVLEEMLQRSTGTGDHVVAQVSVRSLASTLGLAKDTVARAVRRLRDLGVLDAVQARSGSGVFDAGSYRLSIPVACLSVAELPQLPSSVPRAARPPSVCASSGQLSLLPEVTATDTVQEGDVTVTRLDGHGTITLPRGYVRQHMQLGYATTEPGAQGDTSERSLTLATNATTRRGLYMAMTRGQRENLALVVINTHDPAEARAVLEAVLFSDRADIPATVQRRTLAATVPASAQQRRVRIPDWFDQVRADAEESWFDTQQRLNERNTERAAARERVAAARRELPAAQEAYAPFAEQVAAAERIVNEAQSGLRHAEGGLRRVGRIHRRSARRNVETAGDVLAVATDRLNRAEELAALTRRRVNELRGVIDDHHRMDSTRRMFDQFNDLDSVAHDAGRLCHALDQWKHWADGRNLDNTALTEIATAFADHDDRPGISQLAAPLTQWAQRRGLELQPPTPPTPTRPSMGIEIDF